MIIQILKSRGQGLFRDRAPASAREGRLQIQIIGQKRAPQKGGVLIVNGQTLRAINGTYPVQLRRGINQLSYIGEDRRRYAVESLVFMDGTITVESAIGTEEQYVELLAEIEELKAYVEGLAKSVAGRTENNGYQLF